MYGLKLPNHLPSRVSHQYFVAFLTSPNRALYYGHFLYLDLINILSVSEGYKFWMSELRNFYA
jgi:hypothetical protein